VIKTLVEHYNYFVVVVLIMVGLYMVMANANLIKKVVGLGVFQMGVFILFISLGKVAGGTAPIAAAPGTIYTNPLPHVLILTAIVVGVAVTAVALALAVRIHAAYGTLEEDDIDAADRDEAS
jgi:multicomponent Na+:H+ antiporter subunit C